ncbi:MAG: nucleotidyltransferase domain-containing protein [Spirochaetes bacterium]|nr:nucleotidyltransferase domain-containing protein [Spirochaetota bacterium]
MRLSEKEINVIKNSILEEDKNAKVYLFGSRVDDKKRGGDIDILVVSDRLSYSDIIDIKRRIFDEIEEQKIDIIITKDIETSFIELVHKTGVVL